MNPTTQTDILNQVITAINNNTIHLASLPEVVVKINNIVNDDTKGAKDVSSVIQLDVSMSSRVLQISNSPALRGYTEITSVHDAIIKLGVTFIKNLVICVALRDKFNSQDATSSALMAMAHSGIKLGVHSFVVAKMLGRKFSPDMALLVGLVSNLGDMVLLRYLVDNDLLVDPADGTELIQKYGKEITKIILTKWNFPTTVTSTLYSEDGANVNEPKTYKDVLEIANYYLSHKNDTDDELVKQVTAALEEFRDDYNLLTAIFR